LRLNLNLTTLRFTKERTLVRSLKHS